MYAKLSTSQIEMSKINPFISKVIKNRITSIFGPHRSGEKASYVLPFNVL